MRTSAKRKKYNKDAHSIVEQSAKRMRKMSDISKFNIFTIFKQAHTV